MELSMISVKGSVDCERGTIITLNTQQNRPKFTAPFVLTARVQPAGVAGFVRLRSDSAFTWDCAAPCRSPLPASVPPGFDNTADTLPTLIGKRQLLNSYGAGVGVKHGQYLVKQRPAPVHFVGSHELIVLAVDFDDDVLAKFLRWRLASGLVTQVPN